MSQGQRMGLRGEHPRLAAEARGVELTPRERWLLNLIRDLGPLTRAALIRASGLSGPAIFRATEDLAAKGYLDIGSAVAAGRGQPSHEVRLHRDAVFTLGISVTNDFAEAALMDLAGEVRAIADVTAPGMTLEGVLERARAFLDRSNDFGLPRRAFGGVGLAVAGFFVGEGEKLNPVAPLDDWALIDLKPVLEAAFDGPSFVENIASATAVGESMIGAGRQVKSFVYANFAFGFGGGVILRGRLWRGVHGNAGELAAALNAVGVFVPTLESLRISINHHGGACTSISDLVARFDIAWPGVAPWCEQAAASIRALASLTSAMVDVDALVLGGRLPPVLGRRLCELALASASLEPPPRRGRGRPAPSIVPAQVSDRAAVVGAAVMPLMERVFSPLPTG